MPEVACGCQAFDPFYCSALRERRSLAHVLWQAGQSRPDDGPAIFACPCPCHDLALWDAQLVWGDAYTVRKAVAV